MRVDRTNIALILALAGAGGGGAANTDALPEGVTNLYFTDERAQDAVGGILNTNQFSYNDGANTIALKTQMSITDDASGVRLVGDSAAPGNNYYYGTNSAGTKGFYLKPWQSDMLYLRNLSSGVLEGGVLSANANPALFDISDGSGIIVDNWTNPTSPVLYQVTWSGLTGQTVTNLATQEQTYVYIDNTGALFQSNTKPTGVTRRRYIYLGQLSHSDNTSVDSFINNADIYTSPVHQLRDVEAAIGIVNEGNVITANGANLQIDKSSGTLSNIGINNNTDDENPSFKDYASAAAPSFRYRTQTGAGASTSSIDPNNYDVAGVITALAAGEVTTQRVYLTVDGNIVVCYGQSKYSSLAAALAGLSTENFTPYSTLHNAVLIGAITVPNGSTTLNSQAVFHRVNKLGELAGVAYGTTTATLQQIYNNSTTPEILTDSTRGALSLRRGSAADTDSVLEVENGAGAVVMTVKGTGAVTVLDEAYGASWDGSTQVPTKNAVYDKIQSLTSGLVNWTEGFSSATQATSVFTASNAAANANASIATKGTGAFMIGPVPDGTSTGGNSRGARAIDLCIQRSSNIQVASGVGAIQMGHFLRTTADFGVNLGWSNTMTGSGYAVAIGSSLTVSGTYAQAIGVNNQSTGQAAFVFGEECHANGNWSFNGGYRTRTLNNQSIALGNGTFGFWTGGISHSSNGGTRAGTYQAHHGQTGTLISNVGSAVSTEFGANIFNFNSENRAMAFLVLCNAICTAVGSSGTLAANDSFLQVYTVLVQRVGGTLTVIDSSKVYATAKGAAAMNDADFVFTAAAGNNYLKVEFKSPTASNNSSFKVNCSTMTNDLLI